MLLAAAEFVKSLLGHVRNEEHEAFGLVTDEHLRDFTEHLEVLLELVQVILRGAGLAAEDHDVGLGSEGEMILGDQVELHIIEHEGLLEHGGDSFDVFHRQTDDGSTVSEPDDLPRGNVSVGLNLSVEASESVIGGTEIDTRDGNFMLVVSGELAVLKIGVLHDDNLAVLDDERGVGSRGGLSGFCLFVTDKDASANDTVERGEGSDLAEFGEVFDDGLHGFLGAQVETEDEEVLRVEEGAVILDFGVVSGETISHGGGVGGVRAALDVSDIDGGLVNLKN